MNDIFSEIDSIIEICIKQNELSKKRMNEKNVITVVYQKKKLNYLYIFFIKKDLIQCLVKRVSELENQISINKDSLLNDSNMHEMLRVSKLKTKSKSEIFLFVELGQFSQF